MHLLTETLILSIMMMLLCALPVYSDWIHSRHHLFFLLGTGALIGLCFLDLVPDVYELGGKKSLALVAAAWLVFSVSHLWHFRTHHAPQEQCEPDDHHHHHHDAAVDPFHSHAKPVYIFLVSMILHCIASGIMLVVSFHLEGKIGKTVFLELLAHKGYESLIVSSVLIDRIENRKALIQAVTAYALSLPFGVGLACLFHDYMGTKIALYATAGALGSLLACLTFDFMIPSLSRIRKNYSELGWIVFGFLTTQLVMLTI